MKILKYLLLSILFGVLTNCKQSFNGDYLINDAKTDISAISIIKPLSHRNKELEALMISAFVGKTFNISFKEDYVVLKLLNSSKFNDLTLHERLQSDSVLHYYGERIIGKTKFEFRLIKNETHYLIIGIDCEVPRANPLIVPVQLGFYNNIEYPHQARIICYLNKVN